MRDGTETMSETRVSWYAGQRVVINRAMVMTIDRVTQAGRVVIGNRTFNPDGRERSDGDPYRRPRIEPLTAEIEAEMALVIRRRAAETEAHAAIEAAEKWVRRALSPGRRNIPDRADIERAEQLAAVIRQAIDDA